MKKAFFLLLVGLLALAGAGLPAAAQSDPTQRTYYDEEKTKLKEFITMTDVLDPKTMTVIGKRRHGPYFLYYENGKVQVSGQYFQDQKHGEWKYYDQAGKLTRTERYDKGKLL